MFWASNNDLDGIWHKALQRKLQEVKKWLTANKLSLDFIK